MAYIIALAGKGGTGKTTVAGLLVRLLAEGKAGSVLAVDADPNSNLGDNLGLDPSNTIGKILDKLAANPDKLPAGMTKDRYLEYEVQTIVQEGNGFDLLSMGKPEGPGCYCYVNNVLRNTMASLVKGYDYVVIDNEAGLEHLSRKTTGQADIFLVISDNSAVGLRSAKRISELIEELKIKNRKKVLIINQVKKISKQGPDGPLGMEYIGSIPDDPLIAQVSLKGKSVFDLKKDSKGLAALKKILEKIIKQQ